MDTPDHPSPSPSKQPSHSHHTSDEYPAPNRKKVGFRSNSTLERPPPSRTPEEVESGSAGYNTGANTPVPTILRSDVSHEELSQELHKAFGQPYVPKPRPAIRKTERTPPQFHIGDDEVEDNEEKRKSGMAAIERANRLAKSVGTFSASAPASRRNSNDRLMVTPPSQPPVTHIEDYDFPSVIDADDDPEAVRAKEEFLDQADHLLRQHTVRARHTNIRSEDLYHSQAFTPLHSGQVTPSDAEIEDEHVPRPPKFRTGVLGTLLRATNAAQAPPSSGRNTKVTGHGRNPSTGTISFSGASTAANSPRSSPSNSGTATPIHSYDPRRHWYSRSANESSASISKLVESSGMLGAPGKTDFAHEMSEKHKSSRPGIGKRTKSNNSISSAFSKLSKASSDNDIKIKIHLAGTLARQNYLRKLCKALMMYGAPTHRLEEYMNMSARVLEIEAQFLYIPGCMIISFDDSSVHTTEVKLVRCAQGVDLGKLRDTHEIYKDVVHDRIGVDEATPRLEAIIACKPKFGPWMRVPVYGLASAMVGPFAFEARPIDLPFCFVLGCILGWLQLIVAPQNELLTNVFEISAAVITSFIARGLGSIRHNDEYIFCFSAMAQSSIALILPGFTVLSASLELQSRHIVAGSVRMVYAIIYSFFLGFGITIGTVLFGLMYEDATSQTTCKNPMSSHWYYFFVIGFSMCLIIINQAKWKQAPIMLLIALIGYVVNYHSSQYFKGNAQVSNTLGALAIGVSANIHARFSRYFENWSIDFWEKRLRPRWVRIRKSFLRRRHGPTPSLSVSHPGSTKSSTLNEEYIPRTRKIGYGLAAASMLPAIFVQVPSGLSVSGSLVSGITSADQIVRNTTGVTTVSATDTTSTSSAVNNVSLSVGFSVIQVAIGITVGLFLAALIVYPLGKNKRRISARPGMALRILLSTGHIHEHRAFLFPTFPIVSVLYWDQRLAEMDKDPLPTAPTHILSPLMIGGVGV
ncbi:DUF1212-domain-containing protein [Amniculicola lignicola CBS 123094]|uniref:DUF1212-domain-containing protein n=1 Tax=Amniculicola lignicola CBS 123094 TaxID=1392246 RepID=A0A6A5WC83_9PLEO|nr:DUF1212-domain-containing protein [Amniculicola lignicola CBS 123094]